MKLNTRHLLILIVVELLCLFGVLLYGKEKDTLGPQIMLIVDRTENGYKFVIPKGLVYFRMVPVSGDTAKAPLGHGDYMLCRGHDVMLSDGLHMGFRCGQDEYAVQTVGVMPGKVTNEQ